MIDEKRVLEEIAGFKRCQKSENYDYLTGYISALSAVEEMIANQPKVGEWIPCSERLPEEDGEYLVWVRYEGREFTTTEEYEDGMWNYSGAYNFNDKVIAWMPLPEQYKGE